ncbi:MAG: 30S ribosomal protein S12 methylthiotransferase RimO [Oscillospiraceae bacterium]|nr:30S ribosomal protein S12 methylthiotransferase RimO [Oscillospiraceae bacterium]
MKYRVAFIALGCAKNLVNCEQMMAQVRDAGHILQSDPEGADVAVINTCGFIDSAKEEAISNILAMGELKQEGKLKKIIVTGCLSQRYAEEIEEELPEVDGILGTGSYSKIVEAIEQTMLGADYRSFEDIHAPVEEIDRVLTTPPWFAYLRIAEGCDNRCAYCIIPFLRGRFRSRRMEDIVNEAKGLAARGVKELIIVAQDITRYGIDLYGKRSLSALLRELCKLDFHWIRLHYLYPDELDDELIRTIAEEPKILKYLDIPIQHCNDTVLKKMHRRGDKQFLLETFAKLKREIPNAVFRTSLITGLPGEGEEEFEELCEFLSEVKLQRAGVFSFSPQEGTEAATMEFVDTEEAQRRAELLVDVQSRIIDWYNEETLGEVLEILCEGFDPQAQMYVGRSYGESPDIDGRVYFTADAEIMAGTFVPVRITGVMDGELTGELWEVEA